MLDVASEGIGDDSSTELVSAALAICVPVFDSVSAVAVAVVAVVAASPFSSASDLTGEDGAEISENGE